MSDNGPSKEALSWVTRGTCTGCGYAYVECQKARKNGYRGGCCPDCHHPEQLTLPWGDQ